MLTPANMFLLGLISEGPKNPYDIVSRYKYNRYDVMLQIADSSIYSNIRNMCKRGFISFDVVKEGNMPEKKIYTITERGMEELKNSLQVYLSDYNNDWTGFSVALLLMHLFSAKELLEWLKKREAVLSEMYGQRENEAAFVESMQKKAPCIPNVVSSRLVAEHIKVELDITGQAIALLSRVKKWPQSTFECKEIYDAAFKQKVVL